MKVISSVVNFPKERGRFHVALSILIQAVALLALATIVRDERPNPGVNPDAWENMGLFVEFTSIAPLAVLFTVVAIAGLHAIDGSLSASARAVECTVIFKLFTIAVAVLGAELVYYGLWKGIWELFGTMALVAALDLALVFLVFRYLDSEEVGDRLRRPVPNPRSK